MQVKHLGVLTSGGDAPGMNAAIRAAVRTANFEGIRTSVVYRGYQGLIDGDIEEVGPRAVANIIQRGGTMLRTARCDPFLTPDGRAAAAAGLRSHGIDSLLVIGGDGSLQGASLLHREQGIRVIGLPGTIDNDIYGTDVTIGFNTATNVAVDAIDRLRDTAASHDRIFLVEVMGRNSGHIALNVGVAVGAEAILIPEQRPSVAEVAEALVAAADRGKESSIVVVAEGAFPGGSLELQRQIMDIAHQEVRTSILGHMQRGGSPTTRDRVLASRLGYAAIHHLQDGADDVMVGADRQGSRLVPLAELSEKSKDIDWKLLELARVLAT
ncbi:MAG TPA: 6-phosphofructokinase [Deinococcales bacterium]|nr:6-phosphofructokinase [Deinococcales bacterium]